MAQAGENLALDYSWLANFSKNYGVQVQAAPELLNEREGQRVYRVEVDKGEALTIRLCPSKRRYERVLADTKVLQLLEKAKFPAPILRLTSQGQAIFEWQIGAWGYVHPFVKGEPPQMDLPTLREVATLMARLHTLKITQEELPNPVNWLDELPRTIHKAELISQNSEWGEKVREIIEILRDLPDLQNLPIGLIHSDVHEGNLIRGEDKRLYLLDWEDAGTGEFALDIGIALAWNCVWPAAKNLSGQITRYDFDKEWSCAFLNAYRVIRPVSPEEAEKLGAIIRFAVSWFAIRDVAREINSPGSTKDLALTYWAIARSVTPMWDKALAQWATQS